MNKILLSLALLALTSTTTFAKVESCKDTPDTYFEYRRSAEGDLYYDGYEDKITISKKFMKGFSKEAQDILLLHECGHAKGLLVERDADLYALKTAFDEGWLTREIVEEISEKLNNEFQMPRRAKWYLAVYDELMASVAPSRTEEEIIITPELDDAR